MDMAGTGRGPRRPSTYAGRSASAGRAPQMGHRPIPDTVASPLLTRPSRLAQSYSTPVAGSGGPGGELSPPQVTSPASGLGGDRRGRVGKTGKVAARDARLVSTDSATAKAEEAARRRKLFGYLLLLVLSGAGVQIYMRRSLAALKNYSYFVFQSGAIAYFPLVLAVTLFKLAFTKDITPAMLAWRLVPKFALMAFLDSLEDLAVVLGTAHTPLALQTLLPQGVLPVTMLLGMVWVKATYSRWNLFAAACIMLGVVVVVLPSFSKHVVPAVIGFEILLFAGNFPGAASSLYKQASLQYARVDVFFLTTWITFFQIVIGFALTPLNALVPEAEGGVSMQDVGVQFSRGAQCLIGINTIKCNLDSCSFFEMKWVNGTEKLVSLLDNTVNGGHPLEIATCYAYKPLFSNHGNPHNGLPQCDACEGAWWKWSLFIFFVFAYNVLLLKVVKHGSAAFMYAANAVTLPLVNILGTSAVVMGAGQAMALNLYTVGGLVLTLAGLAIWSMAARASEKRRRTLLKQLGSPGMTMTGPARFALNAGYDALARAKVRSRSGMSSGELARDSMTMRRQLYSKLGVSSPGPGRVGHDLGTRHDLPVGELDDGLPLPTWEPLDGLPEASFSSDREWERRLSSIGDMSSASRPRHAFPDHYDEPDASGAAEYADSPVDLHSSSR